MGKLLGPAAADALEAAAGMRQGASPQGGPAKDLREKVADERPKKKVGGFGGVEEIPDAEPPKHHPRASLKDSDADAAHDAESIADHVKKDAPEPPELSLTPKQNHMRSDLEMWIMDEIPGVFGVDDSEELDEDLQEDGQAAKLTELIAESDPDKQKENLESWLKITEGNTSAKEGFRD